MKRLLIIAVVLAFVLLGTTAVSTAGDQTVSLGFQPEDKGVEPGETVEISVVATTDGGHAEQGIADSTLRLEYPSEYLDIVALEAGEMLEADDAPLETDRRVNNTAGVAELDQELPGTREGVVGTGFLAYVTFEIAADAPDGVAEIEMRNSEFRFAVSDFPVPAFGSGALVIGNGGDTLTPDVPDNVSFDATEEALGGEESAQEGDETDKESDTSEENGDTSEGVGSDDRNPASESAGSDDGFGPGFDLATIFFVFATLGVLYSNRKKR